MQRGRIKVGSIEERLEAVTQTLEVVAGMQRDQEAKFDREMAELNQSIAKLTRESEKLTVLMAETGQFINQLARIAEAHEHRPDGHDSRLDELESH